MTRVGVYFQSWSSSWASQHLDLENCEGDLVYLAFVNPSCSYRSGQMTFAGTGLDFSSDFKVVKSAIEVLKSKNKKVMLSVGGATYQFNTIQVENILALQKDLNCDGIDIDWEPTTGDHDAFAEVIKQFGVRKSGYLSAAVFSVGAYGEGQWKDSKPQGMYTGLNRKGLLEAGHYLDWINIMSYDASDEFNPTEAFQAYKSIYLKDIYLGYEVGQQAWGGSLLTLEHVKLWTRYILSQKGHFFIWSWQKSGQPNAKMVMDTIRQMQDPGTSTQPIDLPSIEPNVPVKPPTEPIPKPKEPTEPKEPVGCQCTCHFESNEWKPWQFYNLRDQIKYLNVTYSCLQPHTSQPDWLPSNTPALWNKI